MRLKLLLGAALLGLSTLAQATGFDLYLSDESVQANLNFDSSSIGYGGADLSVGGFYNDDDDAMLTLGVMVRGAPAGARPFSFGVGARGYFIFVDDPDSDVQALAIGGEAKYHIPANMPMAIGVQAHYAPGITTFSDGDDVLDLGIDFEIEITPGTSAFFGYREVEIDLDDRSNDYELEDNFHIGIRLTF